MSAAPATHVDDFIDALDFYDPPEQGDTRYARWMLMHFRLSANLRSQFDRFIKDRRLFCTYEGMRYRCIGASRLGDVWLTSNFDLRHGYERRVDVAQCQAWSDNP